MVLMLLSSGLDAELCGFLDFVVVVMIKRVKNDRLSSKKKQMN